MPTVADVADFLGKFAPLATAADWDNVGLLLGDAAAPVRGIMTCLTVTPETAAEAEAANPTVGEKGRREQVSEWRLEAICPEAVLNRALAAMRQAHSYEEPAYDVYPLRPEPSHLGIGRLGTLPMSTTLADLARLAE